jgi:hypothetical protein
MPLGDIIFSLNRENDLGRNLITDRLKNSNLARYFQKARDNINIQDFEPYQPLSGQYLAVAEAPVIEKNGNFPVHCYCHI